MAARLKRCRSGPGATGHITAASVGFQGATRDRGGMPSHRIALGRCTPEAAEPRRASLGGQPTAVGS